MLAIGPAVAQTATVRIANATRPAASDFQIGDRYKIDIVGAPNQPICVRTTANSRTDWGPVIAHTDLTGRWSTTGQFDKSDFGDLTEVWTVGGKLAGPVIQFTVGAPCLAGGQNRVTTTGISTSVICETAEGTRSFATPSSTEPFRTPDGRVIQQAVPVEQTPEQYRARILESYITTPATNPAFLASMGDQVGTILGKTIGENALTPDETRNVIGVIRAAFAKPGTQPTGTLPFLQKLATQTDENGLKNKIAETIALISFGTRGHPAASSR
jgi:hypothetical protein